MVCLGADLIGFHTHDYVQHFIQSAKMVLRYRKFISIRFNTITGLSKQTCFPLVLIMKNFRDAITNEEVVTFATSLENKFEDQKVIFSVDRLDYTKGLIYRLNGFDEFLERYPEWKEDVIFILNIIPSRDVIETYA